MENEQPKKKNLWIWLLVLIVLLLLGGLVYSLFFVPAPQTQPPKATQKSDQTKTAASKAIFDLALVYGKDVDSLKIIWGKADSDTEPTKEQLDSGTTEWEKTFSRSGYDLLVTYDVKNRKVVDFFLATNDPSGVTKDVDKLKALLNVQDAADYSVESVKSPEDATSFTGIRVVPK